MIITAGIDLSVGAVLVFSGVVAAKLMDAVGGNGWGVILLGLVDRAGRRLRVGHAERLPVAKAKIPPFIVTLGTLGMALGSALLITGGVDEREVPFKLIDTIGIGPAVRPDPLPGADRRGGGADRSGSSSRMTRFGRYTYASAPTSRARGAPASTSTAT